MTAAAGLLASVGALLALTTTTGSRTLVRSGLVAREAHTQRPAAGRLQIRPAREARRRRHLIDVEVPDLLDLLAAGASAGLSPQAALERSCEALRGPLAAELRTSLEAVGMGRRWRDELDSLAERLESRDLRRTVAVLERSESLGTSLKDSLVRLASDVRASRAAVAAEKARKAPIKMLFPLVFLVLPAFLLLTVVPVLLSTIRSLS
ncbi:MAG: type II secretion system F family protein [Actinobacteria bacterium]|nr:type II secretion system F family protein [Actinomycetota bacterium]